MQYTDLGILLNRMCASAVVRDEKHNNLTNYLLHRTMYSICNEHMKFHFEKLGTELFKHYVNMTVNCTFKNRVDHQFAIYMPLFRNQPTILDHYLMNQYFILNIVKN